MYFAGPDRLLLMTGAKAPIRRGVAHPALGEGAFDVVCVRRLPDGGSPGLFDTYSGGGPRPRMPASDRRAHLPVLCLGRVCPRGPESRLKTLLLLLHVLRTHVTDAAVADWRNFTQNRAYCRVQDIELDLGQRLNHRRCSCPFYLYYIYIVFARPTIG